MHYWQKEKTTLSDLNFYLPPPPPFQADLYWARICKRLWSPGINSEESIPPAYVAWRAGAKKRVVVPARQAGNRFLGSINKYGLCRWTDRSSWLLCWIISWFSGSPLGIYVYLSVWKLISFSVSLVVGVATLHCRSYGPARLRETIRN